MQQSPLLTAHTYAGDDGFGAGDDAAIGDLGEVSASLWFRLGLGR